MQRWLCLLPEHGVVSVAAQLLRTGLLDRPQAPQMTAIKPEPWRTVPCCPPQRPRRGAARRSASAHNTSSARSLVMRPDRHAAQAGGQARRRWRARAVVITRQMWTSAATPTTDTRTRACLAALTASSTLPGSHVDSATNTTSTYARRWQGCRGSVGARPLSRTGSCSGSGSV